MKVEKLPPDKADNVYRPFTPPSSRKESHFDLYPRPIKWQQQPDNDPSQWAQQAQNGQPESYHLYHQGTVQPRPHYNHPPLPQNGHRPQHQFEQTQDPSNASPNFNPQWRSEQTLYGPNISESSDELLSHQEEKISIFPEPVILPKQCPIPHPGNSVSETRPDPHTLKDIVSLDKQPKPKPRKTPQRKTVTPPIEVQCNPSNEDSTSNPPKGLATEIQEMADNVLFQQNDSDKVQTNELAPFDSNLVCPVCAKKHRIGEIQKFRSHVKECLPPDNVAMVSSVFFLQLQVAK